MKTWETIIAEQVEGKADLQALYNRLNKQLFSNELPKIPIKWTTASRIPGEVQAQMKYRKQDKRLAKIMPQMGEVTKWKFLGISKKFNLDDVSLEGIMIHEMIHVWVLAQGIIFTSGRDGMHGNEFRDKLHQLQGRANVPIPEKETDLEPSTENVTRPTGYIWLKQAGKNFIVKTTPKFLEANLQKAIAHFLKFFMTFAGNVNETELVEIGVANTAALETVKGFRKIPFKGWSNMTDAKIKSTLENKQVLFRKDRGVI
jgi:hypothetical protein